MAKKKTKAPAKKAGKAKPKKAASRRASAKKAKEPKAPELSHGSICHVDFVVPDLERAEKDYAELFNWQFMPFQPTERFFMARPGGLPGGCMAQGTPAFENKTVLYVNVDDIGATLAKAERLGATVRKPKTEIPGGHGFCAELRMPDGNVVGVYNRR